MTEEKLKGVVGCRSQLTSITMEWLGSYNKSASLLTAQMCRCMLGHPSSWLNTVSDTGVLHPQI